MSPARRKLTVLGLGMLGAALVVAGPIASRTPPTPVNPVIGQPRSVPTRPVAGKRFTVSFVVTYRNTGAPVTRGTMICEPSVAGSRIPHTESFRGGTARLSLVVPGNTAGKALKVKLEVKTGGRSVTRVAIFHVTASGPPSISVGDASITEGSAGITTISLPVTLSAAATSTVTVAYATADGTAKAPSDYAAASGTITFQPGETAKAVTVSVVADTVVEPSETFSVTLSGAVNATLARSTATGIIANDDTAVPVTPGSWKGATRSGNYVYFMVLPDRSVTRFRVNDLPQRCGGVRTSGGEDLGDSVYRIKNNGAFSGTTTWTGSIVEGDVEWTRRDTKLTGVFNAPTSATGTITVTGELNFEGRHYRCSSGNVTWSAGLEG